MFDLPDHLEPLVCDVHDCRDILPLVLFANEEFILGGESNSAALTNETNERHMAL